ncbi:MAG: hypothetical protein RR636_03860 [Clostridium sp.]|uniref:hypothetical protein n=1 Tax=Clostridium sp. TaxID=1506 RepID=UPI00303669B1
MKKVWNNPEIQNMGIGNTNEIGPRDAGHGFDCAHDHHCLDCGQHFETQKQAQEHVADMAKKGLKHHIGNDIIS